MAPGRFPDMIAKWPTICPSGWPLWPAILQLQKFAVTEIYFTESDLDDSEHFHMQLCYVSFIKADQYRQMANRVWPFG